MLTLGPPPDLTHQNGLKMIAKAKADLAYFGVRSPRLLSLMLTDRPKKEWVIALKTPDGRTYQTRFEDSTGRPSQIAEANVKYSQPIVSSTTPQPDPTLRRWIARMAGDRPVKFQGVESRSGTLLMAQYSILKNGIPFVFPRSSFCYSFVFDGLSHRLVSFSANEDLPPVQGSSPSISGLRAREIAHHYLEAEIEESNRKISREWRRPTVPSAYSLIGEPTLGYYLEQHDSVGKLVWECPVIWHQSPSSLMLGGPARRLKGTSDPAPTTVYVYVDAVSGRLVSGFR